MVKGHVYLVLFFWTMSEQCWDNAWPSFISRPTSSQKIFRLSQHGLRPCLWNFYFWGQCQGQDHVWPRFASRPARALIFPKLNNLVYGQCLWSVYFGVPCQDHVLPSFTSRATIPRRFFITEQLGLRPMSTVSTFWDHVISIFGPLLTSILCLLLWTIFTS